MAKIIMHPAAKEYEQDRRMAEFRKGLEDYRRAVKEWNKWYMEIINTTDKRNGAAVNKDAIKNYYKALEECNKALAVMSAASERNL